MRLADPSRLQATGRTFWGPTGKLQEMVADERVYSVLSIATEYRESPALSAALERRDWLEEPSVPGVAPLVAAEPKRGLFAYYTGPVWPLAEVLRLVRQDRGGPSLLHATMELLSAVAGTLDAAVSRAHRLGFYSHGAVHPWSIALTADGTPFVLAFGLPQLDVLEGGGKLGIESYLYCPPERIDAKAEEDLRSDAYSLALVGAEMLLGRSVFDGDAERVYLQASRGAAHDKLLAHADHLDPIVVEVLGRALRRYPDERFADCADFKAAIDEIAHSPLTGGITLPELMTWVEQLDPQGPYQPAEGVEPVVTEAPRWSSRIERTSQRTSRRSEPEPPQPVQPTPSRASQPAPSDAQTGQRPRRLARGEGPRRIPPDHNAMYPHEPMSADAVRIKVTVEGANAQWAKIDPKESLAKSAARLVDALEFSPVDLQGRIRGWYRIVQGDEAWYGDAPTSEIDTDHPIDLEFVPNHPVDVVFERQGAEPHAATVGTGVHVQFLIGELRRQLQLEGTNWALRIDGHTLDPWQILDDFDPQPGEAIELFKKRRARKTR